MQANRQKRPQSVTALREWLKKAETAPQKTQPSVSTQMAAPQKSEKVPTKTPPKEKNSSLLVPALIILAILVVGGISAYLMLGKKSLAKEVEEYRQFRDLPTELDTLAYSIGMAQTKELKEYLSLSMGVDTAYMNEFSQGVLQGSTLSSQQPEAMTGAPQSAYLAGLQIGSQVGGNAVKNLNSQLFSSDSTKTISLKVLMAGFIQGTMGDHVLMTMDEAREKADRLFNKVKADQLQMTYGDVKEKGEKFLNEIAKQRDVIVDSIMVDTPEGKKWVNLIYRPLKKGNGAYPRNDSKVTVQYEGRLIDGTVFDSSYSRGEPVTFPLTNVIKGWQIGLQNMPVGSKYELYIPQELAYGEKSMESIPPYSALIFTIELISVEP